MFDAMHTYKNDLVSFYGTLIQVFHQNGTVSSGEDLFQKFITLNKSYEDVVKDLGREKGD